MLCYGLESHLDLHILLLKPSRLPQVSYIINLAIVPWRIVWVCLNRQDATYQAPLMLAKGGPPKGFGIIRPDTPRGAKGSSTIHTSVYYIQLRNTENDQSVFFMYYL